MCAAVVTFATGCIVVAAGHITPTAVPDEAWVVPSVVLTAVVVAIAVHAEEVRASFDPALPEALREFLLPMCWFTEAHR